MSLSIRPCTIRDARAFIDEHHRHCRPPTGALCAVSVESDGETCGVATLGRPTARMLQDGWTAEVTRVATDGTPNACSALYGALARAARALGYRRLVTYTLASEPGTSLRASGWDASGRVRAEESWSRHGRPRVDSDNQGPTRPTGPKVRWEKFLAAALVVMVVASPVSAHEGHGLGCAYPQAEPAVCGGDYPLPDEVWHAVGHGVSVQALRDSLALPPPGPGSSLPKTVTVGNGTHVVPREVATQVEQHVAPEAQLWTLRLAACESGFNPFAINLASGATGLFQHLRRFILGRVARFAPEADPATFSADTELQVIVTEGLRVEQGTRPWAASQDCWAE